MDPKVVAELQSQLEVEFSELQALIVDSNTFVARISSVWFHFQYAYDLIKRYLADGDNSEELKDALQKVLDSIRIFKTLVTKTSSKYEFVNSLTDRSKYYHEFRELDYDLLEIMEVVNKQDPTGSFASLSHILFDDELDLEMVREMLLGVKHYIKYTDDVDNEEHLASLSALIELIVRSTQFKQSKHFFNSNVVVTGMKPLVGTKLTNSEKSSRGYGSMHRCIWNGAMVGVKIIDRRLFQGDNLGVREAAILSELSSKRIESSPFLAPLLGVSYDLKSDRIYFLSKLAPCGNLHDLLLADTSRTEGLSASAKISILYDVVEGIKHLHIHGLVHGRLKASNVLLYANNRAKVCDYGVQGFLRNRSRLNFQGTDGIRWCPPEILLLETQIEDKKRAYEDSIVVAATSRGNQAPPQRRRSSTNGVNTDLHKKSFGNAVLDYSYLLTSSVDLYAVGLLGMSLLTEKIPFSNVEWEEGVAAQLLKGVVPTLPMSYRDKEILEKFENFILPCIGSVEGRPSILAVSQILEDVYLDITRGTLQAEFDQLQEDNEGVQADLKDLKIKLREHIKIISKGKELIAKREVRHCSLLPIMYHNNSMT